MSQLVQSFRDRILDDVRNVKRTEFAAASAKADLLIHLCELREAVPTEGEFIKFCYEHLRDVCEDIKVWKRIHTLVSYLFVHLEGLRLPSFRDRLAELIAKNSLLAFLGIENDSGGLSGRSIQQTVSQSKKDGVLYSNIIGFLEEADTALVPAIAAAQKSALSKLLKQDKTEKRVVAKRSAEDAPMRTSFLAICASVF
jgi:hypothetical protein